MGSNNNLIKACFEFIHQKNLIYFKFYSYAFAMKNIIVTFIIFPRVYKSQKHNLGK